MNFTCCLHRRTPNQVPDAEARILCEHKEQFDAAPPEMKEVERQRFAEVLDRIREDLKRWPARTYDDYLRRERERKERVREKKEREARWERQPEKQRERSEERVSVVVGSPPRSREIASGSAIEPGERPAKRARLETEMSPCSRAAVVQRRGRSLQKIEDILSYGQASIPIEHLIRLMDLIKQVSIYKSKCEKCRTTEDVSLRGGNKTAKHSFGSVSPPISAREINSGISRRDHAGLQCILKRAYYSIFR